MVGIMDPPRPGVAESIEIVQSAGVKVKMVTGDALETACSIGIVRNFRNIWKFELSFADYQVSASRYCNRIVFSRKFWRLKIAFRLQSYIKSCYRCLFEVVHRGRLVFIWFWNRPNDWSGSGTSNQISNNILSLLSET